MTDLLKNSTLFGDGHTILYPASFSGNVELLHFLIDEMKKTNIDKQSLTQEMLHPNDSSVFLKQICCSGMKTVMERLMEEDEALAVGLHENNTANDDGATPLMW